MRTAAQVERRVDRFVEQFLDNALDSERSTLFIPPRHFEVDWTDPEIDVLSERLPKLVIIPIALGQDEVQALIMGKSAWHVWDQASEFVHSLHVAAESLEAVRGLMEDLRKRIQKDHLVKLPPYVTVYPGGLQ